MSLTYTGRNNSFWKTRTLIIFSAKPNYFNVSIYAMKLFVFWSFGDPIFLQIDSPMKGLSVQHFGRTTYLNLYYLTLFVTLFLSLYLKLYVLMQYGFCIKIHRHVFDSRLYSILTLLIAKKTSFPKNFVIYVEISNTIKTINFCGNNQFSFCSFCIWKSRDILLTRTEIYSTGIRFLREQHFKSLRLDWNLFQCFLILKLNKRRSERIQVRFP